MIILTITLRVFIHGVLKSLLCIGVIALYWTKPKQLSCLSHGVDRIICRNFPQFKKIKHQVHVVRQTSI